MGGTPWGVAAPDGGTPTGYSLGNDCGGGEVVEASSLQPFQTLYAASIPSFTLAMAATFTV